MKRKSAESGIYWLTGIIIVTSLFGLVMVASASQIIAFSMHKDSLYFFKRQLVFLLVGGLGCYLFSLYDYKKIKKWNLSFFVLSMSLLFAVFIPGIGRSAYGSSRWVWIFQPSEIAKFSAILLTASFISSKKRIKEMQDYVPLISIMLMVVLIIFQPDFGTSVLIVLTALLTLLVCGMPRRHFAGFSLTFLFAGFVTIFSSPYRKQRFLAFLDPWADYKGSGYQIIQARLALGSGKFLGVGLSLSKQKFSFLPAAYTDFIFAVIGEELGLLGTIFTVLLFVFFLVVGMGIASTCKDKFGKALAAAITIAIITQASINMGASVGMLPITGIPLPLISYGGTSLLMTMAALGILINIARQNLSGVREGRTS